MEPPVSPAAGAAAAGAVVGHITGALGPETTTTAEKGPAAEEGPTVDEGPAVGGDGPWCTRGLKVLAPLVFAISES